MATVYQAKNRPCWMIAWYDGHGVRRVRSSGTTDKKAADALAAKLESDAMLRREGVIDPRADGFAEGARRPLAEHVEAFAKYLRDKGDSEKHALDRERQLTLLFDAMRAKTAADLFPARVQSAITLMRAQRNCSLRTLNKHLIAVKSLTRWLVREGLLPSDPLVGLRHFKEDADRRHVRRALTALEVAALLRAAESGRESLRLSGPDRAMLYRIALGTGFRASEIAPLTPEDFDLDATPPTITVEGGYTKNRKTAVQPIRRDLAALLAPWIAGKVPGKPVFAVNDLRQNTARWMRKDLAAAGIRYVNEDGEIADFHALRHTYVTEVVRAGATVKEAQTLARHSAPEVTFRVYAHAHPHDLSRTLERMQSTEVVTAIAAEPSRTEHRPASRSA
jgi:integrase